MWSHRASAHRIPGTRRSLPPTVPCACPPRSSCDLEEAISVDAWQMDADVLTCVTSLFQKRFIRGIAGRETLHGEAKEVDVNEAPAQEMGLNMAPPPSLGLRVVLSD